jgi:predicted amidophosphoribosyltransferase
MFGFGKVTCILCDQRTERKQALAVRDRKGLAVCRRCVERWQANGGICPQCRTPLRGPHEAGIFLEGKRSFGHADCGASRLIAA